MSRFDDLFKSAKKQDSPEKKAPSNKTEQPSKKLSKSKDPNYVRTTVYLPQELHRQLKAIAATEGEEMSEIVEQLLKAWMSKHSDV